MNEFVGTKFRCYEVKEVVNTEVWWTTEYKVVKKFKPTKEYVEYLQAKRKEEFAKKIAILKHKLQRQYEMYGEVDEIDFNEYNFYVQQYCKL